MSRSFNRLSARERITTVVEGWFLTEPLLFAAWTMHDVVPYPAVATIRVGNGRIEFNSEFVESLKREDLRNVLAFEAMRILLGHPYARRQPNAELSYQASNITVQECLRTKLPMPRAHELFGDHSFDDQYFEFYYRELDERSHDEPEPTPPASDSEDQDSNDLDSEGQEDQTSSDDEMQSQDAASDGQAFGEDESIADNSADDQATPDQDDAGDLDAGGDLSESDSTGGRKDESVPSDLDSYTNPKQVGMENTQTWDNDDLRRDEINAALREAAECGGWGTIGGTAKEQLLATLKPKLDYRGVLRNFRQSLLSVNRRLTRMKPNRRYGLQQMGSRYEFTTRLLFAVDVSGSMGGRDLRLGFSVISRFFQYGIETIDVIWFDEEIRCQPMTLRRARSSFEVTGRGGTNFSPVVEYIDQHSGYDGLIVFTDGYAPVPPKPKNQRTKILWLFKDEGTYEKMHAGLKPLGRSVFLKSGEQHLASTRHFQ